MVLGDRVQYIGTDMPELEGKTGILRSVMRGYAGVEFDEDVPEGHNLNGRCPDKRGLYFNMDYVKVVPKFHLGQRVYCIAPDHYGFYGAISTIDDDPREGTKYYYIDGEEGEVVLVPESQVATSEEFVPCPVAIGQYVKLKPSQDHTTLSTRYCGYIQNHYWGFPKQIVNINYDPLASSPEEKFKIDIRLDSEARMLVNVNEIEVIEDLPEAKTNFAEYIREMIENCTAEEYQDFKTHLFKTGILSDTEYVGTGRATDFKRNLVRLAIAMVLIPTPQTIESMVGYDIQTHLNSMRWDLNLYRIDNVWNEANLDDWYRNNTYWNFLPLVKADTKEKFENSIGQLSQEVETTPFGVYIKDRAGHKHYIIYYDPYNFESLMDNLLHMKANPESELWQLMNDKRYDEAFALFRVWNDFYQEQVTAAKRIHDIQRSLIHLREQEGNRIKRELTSIQSSIEEYQDILVNLFQNQRNAQLRLLGVQAGNNNEETEMLMQFLTGMGDNLVSLDIDDNVFTIQLKQPLLYIDSDSYRESKIRQQYSSDYCENTLDIVDDIIYGKVTLTIEETVRVNLDHPYSICCCQRNSVDWAYKVKEGIPNPHHYFYNCWGDNETPIKKAFSEANYIVAISQIMSAVGGLKVADGAVMERFVALIDRLSTRQANYWNDNQCIIYNGEKMTVSAYAAKKQKEVEGN